MSGGWEMLSARGYFCILSLLQPYGVGVLVCALYGEENRDTERVKHLSEVTQLENRRARGSEGESG